MRAERLSQCMTTHILQSDWSIAPHLLQSLLTISQDSKTLPSREQLKAEDIIVKYWHHLPWQCMPPCLSAISLSCLCIRGGAGGDGEGWNNVATTH